MTSTVLDHDATTGTNATATGTSGTARGTVTVTAASSSPVIAPLDDFAALSDLPELATPSRTDVLDLLLARSKGWQAALMGMLDAFPTAPTAPSRSSDTPGGTHPGYDTRTCP